VAASRPGIRDRAPVSVAEPVARVEDARELVNLINCVWMSQAICVAAELGIADLLSDGPRQVDALARASGAHAPSLGRLMRGLTAIGLCRECDDGCFALTSTGALLRADAADSLRSWALWSGRCLWPLWGRLLDTVRSGHTARKLIGGTDDFGHLEGDGAVAEMFNRAMTDLTHFAAGDVARLYDFSWAQRIVDIGGGHGGLIAEILRAHPQARGVVYDLPHAMDGVHARSVTADVASRCEFVAGSFFESVPFGADVYVLKSIIHDWDDDRSTEILRNCRRAIAPNGKLLLIERIMPERFESCVPHRILARADLTMLIGVSGRERTEPEFHALLNTSGFRLTRIVPIAFEFNIIESAPKSA